MIPEGSGIDRLPRIGPIIEEEGFQWSETSIVNEILAC